MRLPLLLLIGLTLVSCSNEIVRYKRAPSDFFSSGPSQTRQVSESMSSGATYDPHNPSPTVRKERALISPQGSNTPSAVPHHTLPRAE